MAPVSFTVQASNPSIEPVILESLVDDIHGDLNGQGTCQLPQTLTAGGGTYTCSFTAVVSGDAGDSETDVVTATASDNEGNPAEATAQATVTITDVLPGIDLQKAAVPNSRPEPGGDYDIRISVVNQSAVEPVLLTSLDDDLLGDLDGQGDCEVPQTIAPAGSYQCTIPASLTGDAGTSETDTVTATASDNEGTEVVDSDSATFSIIDRLPTFDLQKTASPTAVPEPGGDVTFTIEITNTSPEDPHPHRPLRRQLRRSQRTGHLQRAADDRERCHLLVRVHRVRGQQRGRDQDRHRRRDAGGQRGQQHDADRQRQRDHDRHASDVQRRQVAALPRTAR